ncbi:MAG TPA: amidohydrolase family protein [Candidatus Polarisedimenticolaceae bacterium]|nr:amidohydrolase family protein [Candidatus Polarisedimenticolaceae bacterium]
MNIDLHSHFFPVEALQNPGKYENRAPKIVLDKDKLSVTSQIGFRPGLSPGAYDPSARIKALDQMSIDIQAISPSPILLFYWEEPAVAAYFSRKQNEAIQEIAKRHPDRFVGFGSVPLQSIADSIEIAWEAKSMGLKGLEIGNAVGDRSLDDPTFEPFFDAAQELDMLLFVHPLEGGLDADDPLSPILGNVLQFTFRTTMMVERMILKGMFEKYPNLRLCLSHGGGLLAFNIWRLDHSYSLRPELKKVIGDKPSGYLKRLYFDTIVHSTAALQYLVTVVGADRVVIGTDYPMAMGDFESAQKVMQLDLPASERELILGGNAARALNI